MISVPLSFFGGIGGASRLGILVKGSNYLEALGSTETVVFDKTGTLTDGTFAVTELACAPGVTEAELVATAAAAEAFSTHPSPNRCEPTATPWRMGNDPLPTPLRWPSASATCAR